MCVCVRTAHYIRKIAIDFYRFEFFANRNPYERIRIHVMLCVERA